MTELLLAAAVLPAAVLMFYVYRKDSVEREPMRLVVRMFVLGMVAGPLAAITESVLFEVFESSGAQGFMLLFLEYFIGVACVEEGFKYLFLNTIRKNPEFNYVFDGVVYAVAVSLGFATLENILYVFDGGFEVAISRAIFAVPGHCADGVVMGCFFGLARKNEVAGDKGRARMLYLLAFVLPVIEHGFYDASLSSESDVLSLIALAVELVFIFIAVLLIKRMSKSDSAIYPETRLLMPFTPAGQPQGRVGDNSAAPTQNPPMPPQNPPDRPTGMR